MFIFYYKCCCTKINSHYCHAAEQFAREAIANQKEAFRSWGIMADWDKCYFTFDKEYMKNLMHQFHKLYEMVR